MKIYRYEMPDFGGPFFTLDGTQRRTGYKMAHVAEWVFGATSAEELEEYFNGVRDIPYGCKIVVREIPDKYLFYIKGQVAFDKVLLFECPIEEVIFNVD